MKTPHLANPPIGHVIPPTDQCPTCLALTTWWVYNPFTRASLLTGGWLLIRGRRCACPHSPDNSRSRAA